MMPGRFFTLALVVTLPAAVPLAHGDNRLAGERSPYLLQHANNPVDWFPWGQEAFAKARRENRPIFLSVGYSTCHWCHVMERESFSDPEIAAFLNDHFVSIKVDREERPDVDRVHMAFVQAATGRGGWPMSVWLTPDLKPFAGGTYYPPRDSGGQAGFLTVLQHIAGEWRDDERGVRARADMVAAGLERLADGLASAKGNPAPGTEILEAARASLARQFDREEGGFGRAPKFPNPAELHFLFNEAVRLGRGSEVADAVLDMALFTLERMAMGGIHDHLGGGFHRYAVDRGWRVPHFEKMLYDQAQLAEAYLIAHQLSGREIFAKTARGILDYALRDMAHPGGGFFSAEDADSLENPGAPHKTEGTFYVWGREEIERALGPDAELFCAGYGVEAGGNAPNGADARGELAGKNILARRLSKAAVAERFKISPEQAEAQLEAAREKLFEVRAARPRTHLDDKILAGWNGLMITALAKGHQVLGDRKYLDAAERCADFIRRELHDAGPGTLARSWRDGSAGVGGFAEDYAYLIRGLIDLYQTDFDTAWLEWALALQRRQDDLFWDEDGGGYFGSARGDPSILVRMKDTHDGAEPSANTVSALNLLRLSHLLGDPALGERAERALAYLGATLRASPMAAPMGLVAMDRALSPSRQIVLVAPRDAAPTRQMIRAIWARFQPGAVWALLHDGASRKFFGAQAPFFAGLPEVDGRPTAYICENFTCGLPTDDPVEFEARLSGRDVGRPRD